MQLEQKQSVSLYFLQMMNGLRKFEVKYSGDPELQPICSFENPALVRLFYKLSTHLNKKVIADVFKLTSNAPHSFPMILCKTFVTFNRHSLPAGSLWGPQVLGTVCEQPQVLVNKASPPWQLCHLHVAPKESLLAGYNRHI